MIVALDRRIGAILHSHVRIFETDRFCNPEITETPTSEIAGTGRKLIFPQDYETHLAPVDPLFTQMRERS